MNIETSVSRISTFSELLPIAQQAKPKVSLLGTQYLEVSGYEGVLPLDALATRVRELIWNNREFAEAEREPGKQLAKRIDHIYEESDRLVKQSNFATRSILAIREVVSCVFNYVFFNSYPERFYWEGKAQLGGTNNEFEFYTRNQFQNKFGFPPEEIARKGFRSAGSRGDRWKAPYIPERIREYRTYRIGNVICRSAPAW